MKEKFLIGDAVIYRDSEYTVTKYSDGSEVVGSHTVQPGQDETAAEYGLTAEEMNFDHDLAHSLVSLLAGSIRSPTLYGVATNKLYEHWWREEKAVLAFQGYVKQLGTMTITEIAWQKTQEYTVLTW